MSILLAFRHTLQQEFHSASSGEACVLEHLNSLCRAHASVPVLEKVMVIATGERIVRVSAASVESLNFGQVGGIRTARHRSDAD